MYIVIELQTNTDGNVGSLINNYNNRQEAENRYYTILAAAAISNLPTHAAVMMSNEGFPIMHQAFHHTPVQVAPEPEEAEVSEDNIEKSGI